MKRLLFLIAIVGLFACNDDSETSSHEQQWSKDGKDSVVYVRYKDESGNWVNFYMQYLLFNSLFNSGGYSACYNHYHSNPAQYTNYNHYTSYAPRSSSSSVGSSSGGNYSSSKSSSSPSRSSWSSGSGSSSSSSSRSYSSPSRSSGSSYSSPSRSYSSPSRSYSSPSRSFSSPSRH